MYPRIAEDRPRSGTLRPTDAGSVPPSVLERVDADLARGHTFTAVQRLTTLVQQQPDNLDLRARLSAVHLSTGNLVEAGRWGYLADQRDPEAEAAFEKAFRNPIARLNALRWRGGPYQAGTAVARTRLLQLIEEAGQQAGQAAVGLRRRPHKRWSRTDVAVLLGVLVVVSVWLVGAATVVGWFTG